MPGTVPGSGRWDGSRVGPGSSRSGERGQSEGGRVEKPRGRPYDGSIGGRGQGGGQSGQEACPRPWPRRAITACTVRRGREQPVSGPLGRGRGREWSEAGGARRGGHRGGQGPAGQHEQSGVPPWGRGGNMTACVWSPVSSQHSLACLAPACWQGLSQPGGSGV